MQAFLIVFDSLGLGAAPDAFEYGDEGSNTLLHTAEAAGGLSLPNLGRLGLGNCLDLVLAGRGLPGVPKVRSPLADFGVLQEVSRGKDTTVGHWEMAGLEVKVGFPVFPAGPPSFPQELLRELSRRTGRSVLGDRAASGTHIIEELGPRQLKEGAWIVYTSADSVLQIAAHEEAIPLEELYRACEIARGLCNPLGVGRVIARPYVGKPGAFVRTENRRDYSLPPPEETVMDKLVAGGGSVAFVGKVGDIFAHRGSTESFPSESNAQVQSDVLRLARSAYGGLVFANLIDFDMLYGHRRDPMGYARALESADAFMGELLGSVKQGTLIIVTADHGNDPTFKGTDHTRELVPLLAYYGSSGRSLGVRKGFYDVAQSLAIFFGIAPLPRGTSFLS